jgi:hypothetical protein
VPGSCERGKEYPGSLKGREFLDRCPMTSFSNEPLVRKANNNSIQFMY